MTDKRRLCIRDAEGSVESWHMYISPLRVVASLLALAVVLLAVVLCIALYTPALDMIPGYPGRQSRQLLIENIMRLDSLERQMNHLTVYSGNISLIMDGKTPVVRDASRIGDSVDIQSRTTVPRSQADSLLREQMESPDGPYSLSAAASAAKDKSLSLDLVPPVHGVVSAVFNPKAGRYGVELLTASGQQVAAVRDGTLIASLWSPESGYVAVVQHANNLVSVYKHNAIVHKQTGERVRGGEIIGAMAEQEPGDESQQSNFEFELWYNGTPVDPQGYIVF